MRYPPDLLQLYARVRLDRTQLAKPRKDGSTVLAYDQREIDKMDPEKLFASMEPAPRGNLLPGWEPERLAHIQRAGSRCTSPWTRKPCGPT